MIKWSSSEYGLTNVVALLRVLMGLLFLLGDFLPDMSMVKDFLIGLFDLDLVEEVPELNLDGLVGEMSKTNSLEGTTGCFLTMVISWIPVSSNLLFYGILLSYLSASHTHCNDSLDLIIFERSALSNIL